MATTHDPVPLQVRTSCGASVLVPINGVTVEFTCAGHSRARPTPQPADPNPQDPIQISDPGSGHIAERKVMLTGIDSIHPGLFSEPGEIDLSAKPIVVRPKRGQIALTDWTDSFKQARATRRSVRLDIRPRG
jgi:hypothetical protein